jgi:Protein of unknown function DUF2625
LNKKANQTASSANVTARSLQDLLNLTDPAWPLVESWIAKASNPVQVLTASEPARSEALLALQVTTRSPMGAIVYETGGLLVDHGWLRILGSGHPRLPRSLPAWNEGRSRKPGHGSTYPFLLVADDVVGGFFAVDGRGLGFAAGEVCYFPPDTLQWERTEKGYTDFLLFCFNGDLAGFYQDYRWQSWESETEELGGDVAFSIYPFPFAAGEPFAHRSRRAVPIVELYGLYVDDLPAQLGSTETPPG